LSAAFADKKQPKQVGKMPEIRKKIQLRNGDDIFWIFFIKISA